MYVLPHTGVISLSTVILFVVFLKCHGTLGHEVQPNLRSFEIDYGHNTFLKDGKKFRYISGSIHYFRSHEERWDSLLKKSRLAGLNAITTYVAWNLHQPSPKSEFNFNGNLNIFKFLDVAKKNNLLVILRPGPYMCAERDMGGFPPWLLWEKPGIRLRTSDLEYNYFVSRWFDELLPRLRPYLYSNGGPIIMMQVENEYGSFGCDKNYTSFLRDQLKYHLGNELLLFSTDGAGESYVKCGSLTGVYPTVDFGPESKASVNKSFEVQRKFAPKGPLVNSEFYPGWLDHWQKPHSKTNVSDVAASFDHILALGANVNIYMFHGGTSFGYGAGADVDGSMYDPCPTSYDYDAPLNEAGDPTEKYFAIKDIISSYLPVPSENPVVSPKAAYGKVHLRPFTGIFYPEFLTLFGGNTVSSQSALSFEELKVGSGFVLYQTQIKFMTTDPILLKSSELKDRAYIYVDRDFVGVLSRSESIFAIPLKIRKGQELSILVENQGRICFGSEIGESKGLGRNISLGSAVLEDWAIFPLGEIDGKKLAKYSQGLKDNSIQLEALQSLSMPLRNRGNGMFYVGNFTISSLQNPVADTFVRLDGFSKGILWVNGFNLGRYWPIVGPQETLYLPGPFLKPSPETNTFLLFELEGAPDGCQTSFARQPNDKCVISLTDIHVLDGPTPYDGERRVLYKKGKSTCEN